MSADVLRQAAALMRERANAATPGPWDVSAWDSKLIVPKAWAKGIGERPQFMAIQTTDTDVAAHIASWHPAVALTVAAWLHWRAQTWQDTYSSAYPASEPASALAVARVYLGEAV